jgi:hypothetical protein
MDAAGSCASAVAENARKPVAVYTPPTMRAVTVTEPWRHQQRASRDSPLTALAMLCSVAPSPTKLSPL